MITVTKAGFSQGYTGYDHLLDSTGMADVVGRSFRSVGEARKAARQAAGPQDRRCSLTPVWVEVMFADGEKRIVPE